MTSAEFWAVVKGLGALALMVLWSIMLLLLAVWLVAWGVSWVLDFITPST